MGKSHREQIGTEHCEMELVGRVFVKLVARVTARSVNLSFSYLHLPGY